MNRQFISVVGLAINHLRQISDKIASLREQDLLKLDQAINTYLLRRKDAKISSKTDEFESDLRSQLISLQQKNEFMLKELDIITRNYQQQRESVIIKNQHWKIEQEQSIQQTPCQELCSELITDLSQFREITSYSHRLQQLRKEQAQRQFGHSNIQQFMQKMQEIILEEHQNALTDYVPL